MDISYCKFIEAEDKIYRGIKNVCVPTHTSIGNEQLNKGLDWLCDGTNKLLDFGCGSGSMLFLCALRGVKEHVGIDFSEEAIKLCNNRAKLMKAGDFKFYHGNVSTLENIKTETIDAIILSNVVDNIKPNDAIELLRQASRILKKNGKILIKLNPYLMDEQIKEWNIKIIEGNLLDDGLMLWNQTTDEWRSLLLQYFKEIEYIDVYFPEHEQYNRMFLMVK